MKSVNAFPAELMYPICLPCIKKCSVNRDVNDEECLPFGTAWFQRDVHLFFLKFGMTFTLTKFLEKSSRVRDFLLTVRNKLSHWCISTWKKSHRESVD